MRDDMLRRILSFSTVLFGFFSLYSFRSGWQGADASIAVLNRAGQATSGITDGDTIRLQVTLSQAVTQQETITFTLGDQAVTVGGCTIAAGSSACQTEPFPSLGWHWDAGGVPQSSRVIRAHDAGGVSLGQSEPLTVRPRPVVMVHGFLSSWDTWKPYLGAEGFLASIGLQGFALGDGQAPGELNAGTINDPGLRTNTIAQNAEVEAGYIAGVKAATGAEMVDLVVHSMGGMISRYYIDRLMQDRDVAQLIMLGSPMGGSDCSVLPAALGLYLPAAFEIRQSYMQGVFNSQIVHRRGVEFYDLGGTAILDAFKSPCADVPNDTVVSFGSINAIPLQSGQADVIHLNLTSAPPVFEDFVRPLLQKSAGTFTFAPDANPVTVHPAPLQFTRVYTGHVQAGGSTELTINIKPNVTVASFALFDPTRSVTVSVRGASGAVIELDPQSNGFIQVDDPASLFYLGYGFANPRPGLWKVSVLASNATPAQGADFSILVYFIGGATLNAQSSTMIATPGEQVRFSASLSLGGQTLEIRQAQALIHDPDGGVETLDFAPAAQISAVWSARSAGTYGVDIVVTGIAPDGSPVERTAFLAVEVQPLPDRPLVARNFVLVIAAVSSVFCVFGLIGLAVLLIFRKITRSRR
jgi:pimeloyl-ACP methyl ester carboxylesterase